MKIISNLYFKGDCAEAFERYAKILGGEIKAMVTFGEVPGEEKLGPAFEKLIMHAWLDVGDQSLMGCDAPTEDDVKHGGFSVAVHVADKAEARRIFDALLVEGSASMPFQAAPWSPGFGMLTDKFGVPWLINTEAKR